MSNFIESIKNLIDHRQQKLNQKKFLEASMGACALLAMADGEISFAELMARDYLLDHVRQLQVFDVNLAADLFRECVEALKQDYQSTKNQIVEVIAEFAEDQELAPLLLRLCQAIAYADRDLTPAEENMMIELGEILKLDQSDISLLIH